MVSQALGNMEYKKSDRDVDGGSLDKNNLGKMKKKNETKSKRTSESRLRLVALKNMSWGLFKNNLQVRTMACSWMAIKTNVADQWWN